MLRINSVGMSAGDFSVKDVSISIPDGCCHVLLGGTGNGKTLILETVAGLRPIANGEIWVDERDVTKEPPENRYISYVPQDLALFPNLSVEKNIYYSKRFKNNHCRSDEEIRELIECMQLQNILNRSIHFLSGGERQRVSLARAFASGNKVLLLDEPFSALHFTMKRTLWGLLSDMRMKYGLSILMVTHDLDEAFFLADDISILHQGRILQQGTKEDIFHHPGSMEVTRIIGHYNYFRGRVLDTTDDDCLIEFSQLKTNLQIKNNRLKTNDEVCMAIRTSDIDILPIGNEAIPACSDLFDSHTYIASKIACRIKNIYDTTQYQQLIATVDQQVNEAQNEIVIDIYDKKSTRNYRIGERIAVSFPEDAILIFKEDSL
jgi:ABC-type Fe3+/spermidine/putrescine transport system ATPase subunit